MTREEEDAAVREWLPVARRVLNRQRLPGHLDREDLLTDAMIGVLRALRTFDPDRGRTLATWVYACAQRAVLDGMRSLDHLPRRTRWRVNAGEQGVPILCSLEALHFRRPTVWQPLVAVDQRDEVDALLRRLPERKARVLRLAWLEGVSAYEVARLMGVRPSRVWQIIREAVEELKAWQQNAR